MLSFTLALSLLVGEPTGLEQSIDTLLRPAVEKEEALGVVVGVRIGEEVVVRGFGRVHRDREGVPDGDTVFEIGSVSKVFTGLLLADAIERGRATVDDPITAHVPEGVVVCADEAPAALRHLATHTSGFPRMPSNWRPTSLANPYVDYSPALLHTYLEDFVLESDPGASYAYSNLGAGLLGQLMAHAHGAAGYEEALRDRIFEPLGLDDTTVRMTDRLRPRFADAATAGGGRAEPWDFDALAGCGAIRSTVNDLLKFGAAQVAPETTPLEKSLRRSHEKLYAGPPAVAYGWHFADADETLWHNGQTGGYHGWLSFDAERGVVVAILSNGGAGARIDAAGMKLMAAARNGSR